MVRALRCLDGLSVGDAFGECFFVPERIAEIPARRLPAPPWFWTDDTQMAVSVVEELVAHGQVHRDSLARRFVARLDPARGYGGGAFAWARRVASGQTWRAAAGALFQGQGSWGNGAAMRAGPVGAFFAGEPERAAVEARASAEVTHAHPEGQAGAVAVAAAASLVAGPEPLRGTALLDAVWRHVPDGATRTGLRHARELDPAYPGDAARVLGCGERVAAADTVPYALFCAAHHLDDFVEALWITVAALGDRDTTCAIVGGLVALVAELPEEWRTAREALPAGEQTPPGRRESPGSGSA